MHTLRAMWIFAPFLLGSDAMAMPAPTESRSFVVSMFYPASYSRDGDCSKGLNPPVAEQYEKDAQQLGYTQDQINELKAAPGGLRGGLLNRAKINGRAVSSNVNPQAAPDPKLNMIDGKYAFGFNLDGKGAGDPAGFEDPFTHETGVDNQLFRALGCFTVFRGDDKIIPGAHEQAWTVIQQSMPAWLITISGNDLSKDGSVLVTFDEAFEHVEKDAQSHVLAGMTFRVDPNPLNHNQLQGVIKGGVITLKQPSRIYELWGEQMLMPRLDLQKVHLRLTLRTDGTLGGMVGGYMPYIDALSEGFQANGGTDWVGVYWNLRKAADANPDPKTGRNRDISATFMLEAVPAFCAQPQNQKVVKK
jgi:hypothetical protein